MMVLFKKTLLVFAFVVAISSLSACGKSLDDSFETLNNSSNHTYAYSIKMDETHTIESVYKQDGDKSFFDFNGNALYQYSSNDKVNRISREPSGSWKTVPMIEFVHLIPTDTIVLNPELLEAGMFEKGDEEESLYYLKASEYETIFGDKAETIRSFSFDLENDPMEFNYAFTHEGDIVPVKVTITYDDAEISLPI